MPKVKISEFSSTPASNTDIDGINLAEGCAPSGINDAIRELMAQLKDFQTGAVGDSFNGPVGTTTAAAGAFTTLSATGVTTVQAGSAGAPAITTTGDTNTGIFFPAADTIAFAEGGAEIARFDSSGNLGLGVTPSAWATVLPVLQASNASFSGYNNQAVLSSNWYYNAGNKYIASGYATQYIQSSGQHIWYTAPSGTAGNAISFTQAMTLDASGNLGVGTTSPGFTAGSGIHVYRTSGTTLRLQDANTNFELFSFGGNAYLVNRSNGFLSFDTNATERARIDSSGNLLVGTTTSASTRLVASGLRAAYFNTTFAGNGQDIVNIANSAGSYSYNAIRFWNDALDVGSVIGSISCTTTATAYNTSSDYRLKNTIAPMTGALAKVALLKPCTYKWNADGSDGEGFIAHELAEVVPQCVTGEKDAVDAEGKPQYQGIDTSFLIATLTAAIQELKAEFDAYKATHP